MQSWMIIIRNDLLFRISCWKNTHPSKEYQFLLNAALDPIWSNELENCQFGIWSFEWRIIIRRTVCYVLIQISTISRFHQPQRLLVFMILGVEANKRTKIITFQILDRYPGYLRSIIFRIAEDDYDTLELPFR